MFSPKPPAAPIAKQVAPPSPSRRGVLVCLAGPPGVGKTSALAGFKDVCFVLDPRDLGIENLIAYNAVKKPASVIIPSDFTAYETAIREFLNGPHRTLVCESLTGIGNLCDDHCLINDYKNENFKFQNFQNGRETAANVYLQRLIDLWLACQRENKHVFLTAHTKVGAAGKNVMGEDWVSAALDTSPQIGRRLNATFMNIFNIGWHTSTEKVGSKNKSTGIDLHLHTSFNPMFPGKNQMGLSAEELKVPWPGSQEEAYKLLCQLCRLSPESNNRI